MARPGWRSMVGKGITENRLLVGYQMARYQDARHINDAALARYMGTTVAELPKLATHVLPESIHAWSALHGLDTVNVGWVLNFERLKREKSAPRRMLSIRLQESEHRAINTLSETLFLNVTTVVEQAIKEFAKKHQVAV